MTSMGLAWNWKMSLTSLAALPVLLLQDLDGRIP